MGLRAMLEIIMVAKTGSALLKSGSDPPEKIGPGSDPREKKKLYPNPDIPSSKLLQ